jgi:hypothetical protein
MIDYITKSNAVLILGKVVSKKKLKFNEETWFIIFKDFQLMVDKLPFLEYYNYIITFDRIKKIVMTLNVKYQKEFDHFINFKSIQIMNQGKIAFKHLDDIILFSSLTHNQIFKIGNISDSIWMNMSRFIKEHSDQMNINLALVIPSLFIHYHETAGSNSMIILKDAIMTINNYLIFLFQNFEILDYKDEVNLINFSDTIFYYYSIFMHGKEYLLPSKSSSTMQSFLNTLIKCYSTKIKTNSSFDLFREIRILHLLAKELNYQDKDFWNLIAKKVTSFLQKDFMKFINEIFPKRLKHSSMSKSEDSAKFQELSNMSVMLYMGLLIETFTSANYLEKEFWEFLFDKIDKYVNFKGKDSFVTFQFVYLRCTKLYKDPKFEEVWLRLIKNFDPKVTEIFRNTEIASFLLKCLFSETYQIDPEELNTKVNYLLANINNNQSSELYQIHIFITFFKLLDGKLIANPEDKVKSNIYFRASKYLLTF